MTPMIKAYMDIKKQYQDKFVFYRMGDFYELFFDDAVKASKILDISLTKKAQSKGESIPMAGVPFHSVDSYLAKIIKNGYSVVVCEQFGDPKNGPLERKVSRILTPGTVIESEILEQKETRYILSIYKKNDVTHLSWLNFSNGDIWCKTLLNIKVQDFIKTINPSEILIPKKQINLWGFRNMTVSEVDDDIFEPIFSHNRLKNIFGENYQFKFDLKNSDLSSPIYALVYYSSETQQKNINHFQNIRYHHDDSFVLIDHNTNKNLDLISHPNNLSLFHTLDYCSNSMGSRMLKDWILQPIRDINILNNRLDRVDFLKNNKMHYTWKGFASKWCDIERLSTKIALKTIKPRELADLRNTLRTIPKLSAWAEKIPAHMRGFLEHAIPSDSCLKLLEKYLTEEPSLLLRDGNVIAYGFDEELDEYRDLQKGHSKFLKEFEHNEKIKNNISNLKVEFNNSQGFYIAISNSHLSKIPSNYLRKQTLKNGERFTTKELIDYEQKALSSNEKSILREKYLFDELLRKLQHYVPILQKQSKVLAEWDVLCSFSEISEKMKYSRPVFNSEDTIIMKNGRHPIIEKVVESFTPNSIQLSKNENTAIITGPNMGGKSTIMRQLALLTIMSKIGSHVPAEEFSVCDIDTIFTRIGANDDIQNGRSTFMVEMNEAAYILNNATEKSLVLIDELGRGTATYDGLSLAWSISQYLANTIKSFNLFATHYLEMTELSNNFQNIKNYSVEAIDVNGKIIFTHLLSEKPTDKSYGIHVAELAGINLEIIRLASNKLKELESKISKVNISNNKLKTELLSLDLNKTSPIDALTWMSKKQNELR